MLMMMLNRESLGHRRQKSGTRIVFAAGPGLPPPAHPGRTANEVKGGGESIQVVAVASPPFSPCL